MHGKSHAAGRNRVNAVKRGLTMSLVHVF